MSIYGYINCHDCRQKLYLGKALHENCRPWAYHSGPAENPPNWEQPDLNRVLWKFLADHTLHQIDVRLEHDMTEDTWAYASIGSDGDGDITLEHFFRDWPGVSLDGDTGT